jgi:heme-degrading monooxygenase HmoA
MKRLLIIAVVLLFNSCTEKRDMNYTDKYIVETKVNLKEGTTAKVLELFKSTNPQLVADQSDWIRASFSSVEGENTVVVRAEWKSKESYMKFSSSEKFKETMGQFGKHFVGKPDVTIAKILFEM